jgi:hypothetical protein
VNQSIDDRYALKLEKNKENRSVSFRENRDLLLFDEIVGARSLTTEDMFFNHTIRKSIAEKREILLESVMENHDSAGEIRGKNQVQHRFRKVGLGRTEEPQ